MSIPNSPTELIKGPLSKSDNRLYLQLSHQLNPAKLVPASIRFTRQTFGITERFEKLGRHMCQCYCFLGLLDSSRTWFSTLESQQGLGPRQKQQREHLL